jgi:hypothetical protein
MKLTEREIELLRAAPYPNVKDLPQEIRDIFWGLSRKGLVKNEEFDGMFNWHFVRTEAGDKSLQDLG